MGRFEKTILVKKLHEALGLRLEVEKTQMWLTDLPEGLDTAKMYGSKYQSKPSSLREIECKDTTCLQRAESQEIIPCDEHIHSAI